MTTVATSYDELIRDAKTSERSGDWDGALERYEAAFARLPREGDATRAAEVLRWIGNVHYRRGDLDLAADLYEASRKVAELNGLVGPLASALNCLGIVQQFRHTAQDAERLYIQARSLAESAGDQPLAAMVEQNLGTLADIRGAPNVAIQRYGAALQRFRRIGDHRAAAWVLNNLGMAHLDREDWTAATEAFEDAFRLAESEGDAATLGSVELNRADLYLRRQHYEHARDACSRAVEIFNRLEAKSRIAEAYKFYGILYRETGKPDFADVHFAMGLGLAETCEDRLLAAELQNEWAQLHADQCRYDDALRCLNRAHILFTDLHARREIIDIERRLSTLRSRYEPVARAWSAQLLESRDGARAERLDRVAELACALGDSVGIDGGDRAWLRVGALVHDVGKSAVPAAVLEKSGPLSSEERRLVETHAVVGDTIAADLDFPAPVRTMIRHHHERWDGAGYPDGLAGESIPISARIVGIADAYDALTTDRSYRPRMDDREALAALNDEAGRAFDPELVAAFSDVVSAA